MLMRCLTYRSVYIHHSFRYREIYIKTLIADIMLCLIMNSKEEVFGKELQYLLKLTPSSACHSNSFFVPSKDRFMISNSQKWCVSLAAKMQKYITIKWLTIYLQNHWWLWTIAEILRCNEKQGQLAHSEKKKFPKQFVCVNIHMIIIIILLLTPSE